MASIGERVAAAVRAARRKKNLTQEKLAEAVGLSAESVSRIEGATTVPSLEHFTELARVLDLDPTKVLGVKSQRRPSLQRARLEAETIEIIEDLTDDRMIDLAEIAKVLARR